MRNRRAQRKRRGHWDQADAQRFISPGYPDQFFEEDRPDWPDSDEDEEF